MFAVPKGAWFSLSFFSCVSSSLSPFEDLGLDSNAERLVEDFDFFIGLSSLYDFFLGDSLRKSLDFFGDANFWFVLLLFCLRHCRVSGWFGGKIELYRCP